MTEPRIHAVSDIVWASLLDGRYKAVVVRKGSYRGSLELWEDTELLLERGVGLAYDATFGADIENVHEWQQICQQFIDNWTRKFFCACCKKEIPRKDLQIVEDMPERIFCKRCMNPWGDRIGIGLVITIVALILWALGRSFGVL
jgi:hypothetical protein